VVRFPFHFLFIEIKLKKLITIKKKRKLLPKKQKVLWMKGTNKHTEA